MIAQGHRSTRPCLASQFHSGRGPRPRRRPRRSRHPQDMITLPEGQEEKVSATLSPREVSTHHQLVFHGSGN